MALGRLIARVSASALLSTALGLVAAAASATAHKPRHPPVATSRETDPDTTATLPAAPAARHSGAAAPSSAAMSATGESETLPPPYHLPVASRARMRDCGLKWQTMKMSGAAGDDIWRDFATRCLAVADGPFEKR